VKEEGRTESSGKNEGIRIADHRMFSALPMTTAARVLGKQVLRSGTDGLTSNLM
jgi:hypothetical protein